MFDPNDATRWLEQQLHQEIPITRAMGIGVRQLTEQLLCVSAPISENINHKQTAFGGSLNTLCTVACWGLLSFWLHREKLGCQIVIQSNQTDYRTAVTSDFSACCSFDDINARSKFISQLKKRGRARMELHSSIQEQGEVAVQFSGRFVALLHR